MRLLGLSPAAIATPAMRAVWEDDATLQAMLDVEAALARAQAACGVVPAEAASAIGAAAKAVDFDLDAMAAAALRAGTPAIPVVAALVRAVHRRDPAAAACVHFGATSQDVVDTALVLQLRRALGLINAEAATFMGALAGLAAEHVETPMLGRTLMQAGPPITFGLKAAGWLGAVARGRERLCAAADEALVLQLGGAVGTLAAMEGRGLEVAAALGRELDLPVPEAPWHAHRDRLASLAAAACILGGSLGKIARDLTLLGQDGVAELAEPGGSGRGGSSTMPHKRNPIASVVALAAANRLPGLLAALIAGLPQENERAAGAWQAEAAVHAEIMLALSGVFAAMREAIGGLVIDPAAMAANIARTRMLPMAERLVIRLAPTLGRAAAHHLAERLAAAAAGGSETLATVAARDPDVIAALGSGMAALLDPAGYTGHAAEFVARLLLRHPHLQQETRDALHHP